MPSSLVPTTNRRGSTPFRFVTRFCNPPPSKWAFSGKREKASTDRRAFIYQPLQASANFGKDEKKSLFAV